MEISEATLRGLHLWLDLPLACQAASYIHYYVALVAIVIASLPNPSVQEDFSLLA